MYMNIQKYKKYQRILFMANYDEYLKKLDKF